MRFSFWLVLSFVFHFSLAFLFVKSQGTGADETPIEYFDMTVLPSGPSSDFPTAKVKVSAPAKVAAALAPTSNQESKNQDSATGDGVADSASAPQDSSSGGGGDGTDGDTTAWSDITRLPKVKKEVKAVYPEEGKKARADGPVVLEVLIDKSGKVQSVKLIRGQGHGLDEAAIEALQGFEFQPAFKGNEPVAVKIHYTYRFKLGIN